MPNHSTQVSSTGHFTSHLSPSHIQLAILTKMKQSAPLVEKRQTYNSKLRISLIIWNIALSSFYFGYHMVSLNFIPTATLKDIYSIDLDDSVTQGIMNACVPVGALFGALGSSFIIARLSRKTCLLTVNALAFVVGGLIYIETFPTLLAFRLCQGLCVGFFSALAPLMIKQLSPIQISGTMGTYAQLNVVLGVTTGCFIPYMLTKITRDETGREFWFISLGFPQIALLIQSLVLLFVFPYETPKYLLLEGKDEEARKLLEVIYKPEFVDQILNEKRADLQNVADQNKGGQTIISQGPSSIPKSSSLTTVVAIHMAMMQQLSGVNAICLYGGDIAAKATSAELSALIPTLINFEQVIAALITGYVIGKLGRKTILQVGVFLEGVASAVMMVGFLTQDSLPDISQYFVVVGLFLFMGVFGLSLGPVVWLYIPEIVQPNIIPYSTAANWISASLVISLFPILTEKLLNGNPGLLFIFFTAWCFGCFIFNIFFVVETKDKSQQAIREEYQQVRCC